MASAITKIAELNGTNSSSVISFTSISSTYKDLMFFGSLRNFASGTSYSHQEVKINFIGSVAFFLKQELTEVANTHNCKIGYVVKNPIDKLIEYHFKK